MKPIPDPSPATQNPTESNPAPAAETTQPGASPEGLLVVRLATSAEEAELATQLDERHYLGADRPVGDHRRQVITRAGQRIAILAWGPASYALKDATAGLAGMLIAPFPKSLNG